MTALRLDVDSLRDPEEVARIGADVDALERMVDEVIREARRPGRGGLPADLAAVASQRAEFWSALADEQGRSFEVTVPAQPLPVRVSTEDLVAVLDAVLGNVFAHTPEGAGLRVEVLAGPDDGATLLVDDAGPGFPTGYGRTAAVVRGSSGGGSTGLGLDIVRRTAEASGGQLVLARSPAGGARVIARFGATG